MQFSRRPFCRNLLLGITILVTGIIPFTITQSFAQSPKKVIAGSQSKVVNENKVPMVKTQTPGFYRMMLGSFEITSLYDGPIEIDTKLLNDISDQELQVLLARMSLQGPKIQTAINAYLINTGKNLVLVDTGAGNLYGPDLGRLKANMAAAGYMPEQVDTILITHLHPDHIGGLVDSNGKPAFPNARVYIDKLDNDFWLSQKNADAAPEAMKRAFKIARDIAKPYIAANKWIVFDRDENIVPGVTAIATPGHTPGHTSYKIESSGKKLIILGDIVHNHAVQFARPNVSVDFDVDAKKAIETRHMVFKKLATTKDWAAGMHLPFPGIGHVVFLGNKGKANAIKNKQPWEPASFNPNDDEYAWVRIEYAPLKK